MQTAKISLGQNKYYAKSPLLSWRQLITVSIFQNVFNVSQVCEGFGWFDVAELTITCSKLTVETPEQDVKFV